MYPVSLFKGNYSDMEEFASYWVYSKRREFATCMILIGQLELNAGPELPGLMCNTVGFYLKGPQMGQLLQIVQVA